MSEAQKAWTRNVTSKEYDLKILTRDEFCAKWGVTFYVYGKLLKELQK
jgi:hypothetical protein